MPHSVLTRAVKMLHVTVKYESNFFPSSSSINLRQTKAQKSPIFFKWDFLLSLCQIDLLKGHLIADVLLLQVTYHVESV